MTQDEIIRMAREAGFEWNEVGKRLERFAALVAAHERERAWTEKDWDEAAEWIRQQEREACAKECDEEAYFSESARVCAAAIRARS